MSNRPQPRILQVLFLAGAALWLSTGPRRPKRALLWSALCLAADLIAIPAILRAKPAIGAAELDALRPDKIPAVDLVALKSPTKNRAAIQKRSDRLLQLAVVLPALLLIDGRLRQDAGNWLREYVWGHALTYTVYTFSPLGPAFTDKYRPVVYRSEVPIDERSNGNNRNSQYSGHTGNAAFAGVFFARQLAQRFGLPPIISMLIGATPAFMVGSLRVRAQKHFPSDVGLASIIGGIIAIALSRPIGNERVICA